MQKSKRKLPPKGSQARTVYEHLKAGNTLSSREAIDLFQILRLPNRISELRNKYDIDEEIFQVEHRSKENHRVRWVEYSFHPLEGAH